MKTMLKYIIVILMVLCFTPRCLAQWQGMFGKKPQSAEVLVPPSTEKVKSSTSNFMGEDMNVVMYESSLSFSQIKQFYRNELAKQGWEEMVVPLSRDTSGSSVTVDVVAFMKDKKTVLNIAYLPIENDAGKTFFSVGWSQMPSYDKLVNSEPTKIDFIPFYPGAKQMMYKTIGSGVQIGYLSKDAIETIIAFYKSRMVGYGWEIEEEMPIESDGVTYTQEEREQLLKYCRECAQDAVLPTSVSGTLTFRRGAQETCQIFVQQVHANIGLSSPGYNEAINDPNNIDVMNSSVIGVFYSKEAPDAR
ncbi:MAG: hypothetical protein KBA46_01235 [Candidatus Omnitrophica bacterium]|nr:hypothetical protein [Candidatus Omnitrophota bacterium]